MNRRKIVSGGILGLLLLGAATAFLWPKESPQAPASQQITETTVATRNEAETKINRIPEPQQEKRTEKPEVKPIKDVFVYTFEGDKVFIVAGSVTTNKNTQEWQAKIKNVNSKGEAQSVQSVSFKQEGTQILTCSDQGQWRSIDEMDRSLFNKVVDISGNY